MTAILRLISMGVPAAKIIAKYGKKSYNVAKKKWSAFKKSEKEEWKDRVTLKDIKDYHGGGWKLARNLASIPIGATIAGYGIRKFKKSSEKKEKKLEKKKGGKIKTYAGGSRVRKPKMTAGY